MPLGHLLEVWKALMPKELIDLDLEYEELTAQAEVSMQAQQLKVHWITKVSSGDLAKISECGLNRRYLIWSQDFISVPEEKRCKNCGRRWAKTPYRPGSN